MVVDSSALIAILLLEEDASELAGVIYDHPDPVMSSAGLLEVSIVRGAGAGRDALDDLDEMMSALDIRVVDVSRPQVMIARDAYLRFGKGLHPAGLNFGDCFAYALAKELDVPLLFKDGDFALTDIEPALRQR